MWKGFINTIPKEWNQQSFSSNKNSLRRNIKYETRENVSWVEINPNI